MDRDGLTAWLATEYDALFEEADIAATDSANGLSPVLDAVSAIVDRHPDLTVAWERMLARYYALDRVLNRFAVKMNVSISGDSYSLQQQFANVKALRDEARRNVAWLIDPDATGSDADDGPGTITTLDMPFLTGGDAW